MFNLAKNKFILTGLAFFIWMLFFDENSIPDQVHRYSVLSEKEAQEEYLIQQIDSLEKDKAQLLSDKASQEKFAREKYLMKRDDEELFLIVKPSEKPD